jgi:hypothetical protein
MNLGMIDILVGNHTSDIRCQAARRATARGQGPRPAAGATSRPGLRSRIGFALVEVGLHLQVRASPTMGSSGRVPLNERSY